MRKTIGLLLCLGSLGLWAATARAQSSVASLAPPVPAQSSAQVLATIIEDRRRGGGGVLGAIVAIALVLLLGWFLLNVLGVLGDAAEEGAEINVPEDVNVDVDGEG